MGEATAPGRVHTTLRGWRLLERAVTWGLRRVLLTCEQSPPAVSPRSPHGPDKPSKQPPGLLAPKCPLPEGAFRLWRCALSPGSLPRSLGPHPVKSWLLFHPCLPGPSTSDTRKSRAFVQRGGASQRRWDMPAKPSWDLDMGCSLVSRMSSSRDDWCVATGAASLQSSLAPVM